MMEIDQYIISIVDRSHKLDPEGTETDLLKIFSNFHRNQEMSIFLAKIPQVITELRCNRMKEEQEALKEAKKPANFRVEARQGFVVDDSVPLLETGKRFL